MSGATLIFSSVEAVRLQRFDGCCRRRPLRSPEPALPGRFRQRPEHAADIKAVIAWLKQQADIPVWLVGTSRGHNPLHSFDTALTGRQRSGRYRPNIDHAHRREGCCPVPEMPLGKIRVPTLVVHHKWDGCPHCQFDDLPKLMDGLSAVHARS